MANNEKKKFNLKLGNKLHQERKNQRKTQEEWAEHFEVEPRHYRRYEVGEITIPYKIMKELHETYNVDLNSFICDD